MMNFAAARLDVKGHAVLLGPAEAGRAAEDREGPPALTRACLRAGDPPEEGRAEETGDEPACDIVSCVLGNL